MVRRRIVSTAAYSTDHHSVAIEFGFGPQLIIGGVIAQAGAMTVALDVDEIKQTAMVVQAGLTFVTIETQPFVFASLAVQADPALAAVVGQRIEQMILAAQARPGTTFFDMQMVAQTVIVAVADPATAIVFGDNLGFKGAMTFSTVYGPDVFHTALRRDSTIVFVRHTGV